MEDHITLHGTVERIVFENAAHGFVIFLCKTERESLTIKGTLPQIQVGQELELKGRFVVHPKFGRQFEAHSFIPVLPSTILGLKKYLGSGLIKGIGKVYAEKIVDYFKTDVLDIIDKQPERLHEVRGLGEKRIETIKAAWKDQKEIASIMVFLQEKGISPTYAVKIYKHYQHNALAILHENPYKIADDIWGIGFKYADQIALKMGFGLNAPQRIRSGICYVLSQATTMGHLYVELEELKQKTHELLGLTTDDQALVKQALHDLYYSQKITVVSENNVHFVGSALHHHTEQAVAKKLYELLQHPSSISCDSDVLYQKLRFPKPHELHLNEQQQLGVLAALQNKVTIITGGPGTGKTTLIKKLLTILDEEKIRYKLAAPTGRAAKRIFEGTGKSALTIHRLLEFDVSTMRFTHDEKNALDLDILIIDESSMVDIFLIHSLLKALPYRSHLLLIGDSDQLPSVGAGNVLHDIIASKKIPVITLTEIFRQARDSLIIVNAHRINRGEFPVSFLPDAQKDFIFIKQDSPESLIDCIKRIIHIELSKRHFSPQELQILAPMNRGIAGTQSLNAQLQQLLNPQPKQALTYQNTVFKQDDKVMQIRNNYDKMVFNGDIGKIKEVNTEDNLLMIEFGERILEYEYDSLNEIILAYAITIHKSQGSEYDVVIIPVFMQHFMLLQRNLIYTAITRAKKLCIFIGQPKAIAMAIKNNSGIKRITFLARFLNEQSSC